MPNLAFKSETNLQTELMRLENLAAEAREQLKTAKVRALRAENKYTEAAKLVKDSERKILQQQYRIDSLAETLATNSTALLEVVFKAKETEENAEKKEKALREHITELVEQHRETVAQLNARNVILQDEVNSGKEARLQLTSEENQRVKDAEEAARRAKGEANHLVRSQTGQLNKLKAMCNAYRERYGNLDDAKASDAKTPSLNALSSAPSVKQSGEDQPSTNGAIEGTSQSFAQVDSVSSQSAATWVSQRPLQSTFLSN